MSRPLALSCLLLAVACGAPDGSAPDTDTDGVGDTDAAPLPFADHPIVKGSWMNVAHRGGAFLAPEQTVVAYDAAVAAGADVLEIDVAPTKDGVIVCLHDETVNRTTDPTVLEGVTDPEAPLPVRSLTWAQVQQLDAAHWYVPGSGVDEGDDRAARPASDFPQRGQGVVIPTLEEVLTRYPDAVFSVEIKQASPSIVDEVLAIVDAAGARARVVIGSFDDSTLQEVRTKAPDVLTTLGVAEGLALYNLTEEDEADYVPPSRYFAAPLKFGGLTLGQEELDRAERVGLVVHLWTINDEATMREVFGWGARGIISDDPVTLQAVIDDLAP